MPKKYYHYQREGEDRVLEEGLLKVPSFHLTGAETMKFIKEADIRTKEKEAKQKEKEEIDIGKQIMMFGHVTTFQDMMPKS